jgi:hypothetical protein
VVFGGEQYGAGSSRDWAAKGTNLLGVKAVIAESFERIHRSNLVGMGVIPFEFTGGDTRKTLGLKGDETVSISGLDTIQPLQEVPCTITYGDGSVKEIMLKCRIDTAVEIEYIEHGGVLHYVLRDLAKAPVAAEYCVASGRGAARQPLSLRAFVSARIAKLSNGAAKLGQIAVPGGRPGDARRPSADDSARVGTNRNVARTTDIPTSPTRHSPPPCHCLCPPFRVAMT